MSRVPKKTPNPNASFVQKPPSSPSWARARATMRPPKERPPAARKTKSAHHRFQLMTPPP
jgi:hypothetical protein